MEEYIVSWIEIHNVQIEARNEEEAKNIAMEMNPERTIASINGITISKV